MPAPVENSVILLEYFRSLEGPRVGYLVEHRLLDIIHWPYDLCSDLWGQYLGGYRIPWANQRSITKIAQQIIDQGGDYVLSLKGNQDNIHEDVVQLFEWTAKLTLRTWLMNIAKLYDGGHGRIEIRLVLVT